MTCQGHVENGAVVLDEPAPLRDGAIVTVVLAAKFETESEDVPSLYDQLKPIIGIVKGLPADFAENHDRYIHGCPKK